MMTYNETVQDIFEMPEDYTKVHCISADIAMGRGIAVEFDKRYDIKKTILSKYSEKERLNATVIYEKNVMNLITKEKYYQKPTYYTMRTSLVELRRLCKLKGINKLTMPIIGCDLDKLQWDKVREILIEVFEDTGIEIFVCFKPPKKKHIFDESR